MAVGSRSIVCGTPARRLPCPPGDLCLRKVKRDSTLDIAGTAGFRPQAVIAVAAQHRHPRSPDGEDRLLAGRLHRFSLGSLRAERGKTAGIDSRAQQCGDVATQQPERIRRIGVFTGLNILEKSTATIPVVLVGTNDPSGGGFGASLSRPVGNVTGFSSGLPAVLASAALCRFCCKSPKLPGADFLAVRQSDRRPPIDVAPITLPRSPASLSSGDEVPHIFTRKSRVQPKEILIASAKRLLQQNLPTRRLDTPQQK